MTTESNCNPSLRAVIPQKLKAPAHAKLIMLSGKQKVEVSQLRLAEILSIEREIGNLQDELREKPFAVEADLCSGCAAKAWTPFCEFSIEADGPMRAAKTTRLPMGDAT
jgi:heterodisulfide reductase subunit A-like polyferredoxin